VARGDRALGAALGVGAIAGLGILLLSRRAPAMVLGSPRDPRPGGPPGRFPPLVERWRAEVARRSTGTGLPVDALLAWIQIESGGDTCSGEGTRELGIWQLYFPADAKYGATPEGLAAICAKSKLPGFAVGQLSEAELDMEVGAGIRKVIAARATARDALTQAGVAWPETSFDFGSAVKQIHAAPAVVTELVPKIVRRDGSSPASWDDLRRRVMGFPVEQMSGLDKNGRPYGLRALALAPSKHGLKNRLEDTLRNAEIVGRAWGSAARDTAAYVGRAGWAA